LDTSQPASFNVQAKDYPRNRVLVDSKQEADHRLAKALNRPESKIKSPTKAAAAISPISPGGTGGSRLGNPRRDTMMSMSELQSRHESRLKALQRPTSMIVEEQASLIKAKEEWTKRSRMERRRWEEVERVQKSSLSPTPKEKEGERPGMGSRSKSMSMALSNVKEQRLDALEQVPEQSGVSRAKEWRKSMHEVPNEPTASVAPPPPPPAQQQQQPPAKPSQRKRYSSTPLLDFTTEALREQTKEKVQRL
jgi:hypothetical protein